MSVRCKNKGLWLLSSSLWHFHADACSFVLLPQFYTYNPPVLHTLAMCRSGLFNIHLTCYQTLLSECVFVCPPSPLTTVEGRSRLNKQTVPNNVLDFWRPANPSLSQTSTLFGFFSVRARTTCSHLEVVPLACPCINSTLWCLDERCWALLYLQYTVKPSAKQANVTYCLFFS